MDAATVGALYRKSRDSHIESVTYLIECGMALRAIKASIPHGEWLLWVQEHKSELGFGDVTARRLMAAALNQSSTTDLTNDEAAKLSGQIWRNEPEISPYEPTPYVTYFTKFLDWTAKRSTLELAELFTAEERGQLADRIVATQRWLSQLSQALVTRRAA